jgi:sensor histidine kinase regulating citrate/malate metabolism
VLLCGTLCNIRSITQRDAKDDISIMNLERIVSMDWTPEFPASITICNPEGVILALNEKACETFADDGGIDLIGKNLLDCHPEPSRTKVAELLRTQQSNVYTIEKAGIKKLIYQSPWYIDGTFAGLVELSLPLPADMPHFVRDKAPRA